MLLLSVVTAVLLAGCSGVGGNSGTGFVDGRNFGGIVETTAQEEEATRSTAVFSGACFGVIIDIDTAAKTIRLLDLVTNTEAEYSYSGGTYMMDKYGKDISVSQLSVGEIVQGGYDTGTRRLKELKKSDQVWENQKVTNFTIDHLANTMRIGGTLYEYRDNLVIAADGEILDSPAEISNQDELIVRGSENTVYSVVVTRGHGYVTLTNAEYFTDGLVSIGSRIAQRVTENMVIEVPEGKYVLEITKDGVGGRMDIEVTKNRETKVNVGALKGEAQEIGSLRFRIEPENAKLYIDDKETEYTELVKLFYGAYQIRVEAEGYVTYTADLLVSENYQKREIRLGRTDEAVQAETESTEESSKAGEETVTASDAASNTASADAPSGTTQTAAAASESTAHTPARPTVTTPTVTAPMVTAPTVTAPAVPKPSGGERQTEGMGNDMETKKIENYKIHVEAPAGASVYFDGEYVGVAPVSFQKVSGEHTIIFRQDGYKTKTYTITVSEDKADSHYSYPALVPE